MAMIRGGSAYVCDPRPQERVLAAHPSARCSRVSPAVCLWRVRADGAKLGEGLTSQEAWNDAAAKLPR
jgi:hypothetical protein